MDSGELLRDVELRLLRCTLPPSPSPLPTPTPTLKNLLTLIKRRDYAAAVSSPVARSLSTFTPSSPVADCIDSAAHFYHHLDHSLHSFLAPDVAWLDALGSDTDDDAIDDGGAEHRLAPVLCVGVAAMLTFVHVTALGEVVFTELYPPLLHRGCGRRISAIQEVETPQIPEDRRP